MMANVDIQMQDYQGNIIHPQTNAKVVEYKGSNVSTAIDSLAKREELFISDSEPVKDGLWVDTSESTFDNTGENIIAKQIKKYMNDKIGDLSRLSTDTKDSLVNAINENTSQLSEKANEIEKVKIDYAKKTDVNTLANDKANKSEVATVLSKIDEQKSRVDALTKLPSNGTVQDAILSDGSIGANGYNYSNIGNAIREQIKYNTRGLFDNASGNLRHAFNFVVAYMNQDGTLDLNKKFRLTTGNILFTDKDIYIKKSSTEYMWIAYFNGGNSMTKIDTVDQRKNAYVIPANSYFRISLAQFPLNAEQSFETVESSRVLDNLVIMYRNDYEKKKVNEYTNKSLTNKCYENNLKNLYDFDIASFEGSNETLLLNYNRKDRISTPFICYAEKDIKITVNKGYFLWILIFENDGFTNTNIISCDAKNGKQYRYIKKGTYFKIQLADSPIDTSIQYSTIDKLLDKIDIEYVNNYMNRVEIEDIKKDNYTNLIRKYAWEIGYLNSNGTVDSSKPFRVTMSDVQYANEDLIVKADYNSFVWIAYLNDKNANQFKKIDSFKQNYFSIIPKGSYFKISIAYFPLNSALVHKAVEELLQHVSIYTLTSEEKKNREFTNTINDSIINNAHRGMGNLYPENTLIAYKNCFKNGITVWETDIKKTKDGVYVLCHDDTIKRTARNYNGTEIIEDKRIVDCTYNELLNYDFGISKSEMYKGEPIPTLEQLLKLAKQLNCFVNIDAMIPSYVEDVYSMVKKYGMENNVLYSSFDINVYTELRKVDKNIVFAFNMSTLDNNKIDQFALLTENNGKCYMQMSSVIVNTSVADYVRSKNLKLSVYVYDSVTDVINVAEKISPDIIVSNNIHTKRVLAENIYNKN